MKSTRSKGVIAFGLVTVLLSGIYFFSSKPREEHKTAYQQWASEKIEKKRNGQVKSETPEIHGIIQRELRTKRGDSAPNYGANQVMEEFIKAKRASRALSNARNSANGFHFEERGPGNVAGRTRGLIVDPDDPNLETFYAGAASGGVWKTSDAGANWTFISGDIPNMGVNTLAMAPSNTDVIYAGTGEHFTTDIDGAGMFKSIDRGDSWEQIADPSEMSDFKNISRIVVDPNDENTVVVATRSTVWGAFRASIYKTVDGGATWTRVRTSTSERYDDLDYDPSDFNTIYAAVRNVGVIKSTDAGDTWQDASNGLAPEGRVEITVSPVNTDRVWASVEGTSSGTNSDLYVSSDGGGNWTLVLNQIGDNEDFLGRQGFYDNIITAHPFDEDIVYVGGVNTWKFSLTGLTKTLYTEENGTGVFMSFINFGGEYLGGGMQLGEIDFEDLLPIEIRFGQGTQKAHRFTVGGQGAGVPAEDYTYEDYVEVPFQVWDTKNNVQLMASFRDQQEDGKWNLIASNTTGDGSTHSREYLYIHNIPYSETASIVVAEDAGHEKQSMYFFWPVLSAGASFNEDALPVSNLAIVEGVIQGLARNTTNVSDAYNEFGGTNAFPQSTRNSGLHPDQHNIVIYDVDQVAETFRMLVGNDGGVYRTLSSADPGPNNGDFEYISYGYNTTQFYSADKAPGENRYAGGMQDNGTWYHPQGTEGGAAVNATFGIGGDGFETIWHAEDLNKIIGGSQFNNFAKTVNGGASWGIATSGFNDVGPFITRLANHKSTPDVVFTVGSQGVWYSENFGTSWTASSMNSSNLWSFTNSADVEVSYANPDVIWAGGRLQDDSRLFVSTDGGQNFSPCANYTEFDMGFVSGIGTHPSDDQVAYALFSFAGFPKVIKTSDLGENWEDISGFSGVQNGSDRGFPDVAVNCLFVFPNDTDHIWVGSEIGIIESLDGGASWALLDANLPPVNIYDLKRAEDQIVVATYGRGIWSTTIEGGIGAPIHDNSYTSISGEWVFEMSLSSSAFDSVEVYLDEALGGKLLDLAFGSNTLTLPADGTSGVKEVELVGHSDGVAYRSETKESVLITLGDPKAEYFTDFTDAEQDFTNVGLSIGLDAELNEAALHSPHPYETSVNYYAYFKYPVTVDYSKQAITYDDIALVEAPNDQVVLEASNNGSDWIALEEPYNASLHEDWQDALNNNGIGSSLFRSHSVDLKDFYSNDEQVLLRFKMISDDSGVGFGWVVDNLSIQENEVLSAHEPNANTGLVVYPNPVRDEATLLFNGNAPEFIEVYGINGQRIQQIKVTDKEKIKWNVSNLNAGIYLLNYQFKGGSLQKKVVVKD